MTSIKRFNEWPAALAAAGSLAVEHGVSFRVYRDPFPLYGWHWWLVEPKSAPPADLSARRQRAATVAELHAIAEQSAAAARRRRIEAPR